MILVAAMLTPGHALGYYYLPAHATSISSLDATHKASLYMESPRDKTHAK
jgi:hypothetical protein